VFFIRASVFAITDVSGCRTCRLVASLSDETEFLFFSNLSQSGQESLVVRTLLKGWREYCKRSTRGKAVVDESNQE